METLDLKLLDVVKGGKSSRGWTEGTDEEGRKQKKRHDNQVKARAALKSFFKVIIVTVQRVLTAAKMDKHLDNR